jgi:hypothetical protein
MFSFICQFICGELESYIVIKKYYSADMILLEK